MRKNVIDWKNKTISHGEIEFEKLDMTISTDRYISKDYADRERELIWMKTWQIAGREDELPEAGDWKEYKIFNQSFVIVRGSDGKIRGFVNACTHRGNKICNGKGNSARLTCAYHLWSFGHDGRLIGTARPDLVGPLDKEKLGLIEVLVDCFAGFIFLNPDPEAEPLASFIGEDVAEGLAPYRLDEMVPVGMNVKEDLKCNWKVVIDGFSEGYHIIGIHPELLNVTGVEAGASRHGLYKDHRMVARPFEVKDLEQCSLEEQIDGIRTTLATTNASVKESLPQFEAMIKAYRAQDGELAFPENVTVRSVLQQAMRETLTQKGLDVSGLSDAQMSDTHAWSLFPNCFMSIRAGAMTVIIPSPHSSGDPGRCTWQVTSYKWLPPEQRQAQRTDLTVVEEPGSYPYFLALQQDYDQMQRQQEGLENRALKTLQLGREEVNVAWFEQIIDRYMQRDNT